MIDMFVTGAGIDATSKQPMLLLTDKNELRTLPILLGAGEPEVISVALRELLTHLPEQNLLLKVLQQFGFTVGDIRLQRDSQNSCSASIRLVPLAVARLIGAREIYVNCAVYDAAALAVRTCLPLKVSEDIMAEGSVPANPDRYRDETNQFHDFVSAVNASDFTRSTPSARLES